LRRALMDAGVLERAGANDMTSAASASAPPDLRSLITSALRTEFFEPVFEPVIVPTAESWMFLDALSELREHGVQSVFDFADGYWAKKKRVVSGGAMHGGRVPAGRPALRPPQGAVDEARAARMSRPSWNFGGGPVVIMLR